MDGTHIALRVGHALFVLAFITASQRAVYSQDAKQIVQQAVQTEISAAQNDHSRWTYFESDRDQKLTVKQWVAETQGGSLKRVVERNGQSLSLAQQRQEMDNFVKDGRAQAKQRKSGQQDDEKAAELLKLLPNAFIWTSRGTQGSNIILHFKPDPQFRPPDMEARVFAAMEGDMAVDTSQHRIASLKGRLIRDVKIGGGLLGELKAGGTFDVKRRELTKTIWQITETHVHIQGHALIFKNISVNEDDEKSKFNQLPENISLQQAEMELLKVERAQK